MVEGGPNPGLAQEALERVGVVQPGPLHRDELPAVVRGPRLPDLRHCRPADGRFQELVSAQELAQAGRKLFRCDWCRCGGGLPEEQGYLHPRPEKIENGDLRLVERAALGIVAEHDLVARKEFGPAGDAPAVDPGAVKTVAVADIVVAVFVPDDCVVARDPLQFWGQDQAVVHLTTDGKPGARRVQIGDDRLAVSVGPDPNHDRVRIHGVAVAADV